MADLDLIFRLKDEVSGGLSHINDGLGDLGSNIDAANKKTGGLGSALGGLGKVAGGVAIGGLAAVSTAAIGVGVSSFNMANDIDVASKKMQSQLGLNAAAAEDWEQAMKGVFANNFGENFDDIAQSMVTVQQQMGRIGGPQGAGEIQNLTEIALSLRDAFGIEVAESTNAAIALMSEFGVTSDVAFGFVTKGLQRGLNANDDFLDTIGEYSNQFAVGGASAGQFFSILESGLQSGTLGTDKIADAYKEFSVRVIDDTDATRGALSDLGIDADELWRSMSDGVTDANEAFGEVIERLRNMEDPVERARAAFALFGSTAEDITVDNLLNIDMWNQGTDDLADSLEDLDKQYETLGAMWEQVSRDIRLALLPIGEELLSVAQEHMPAITTFISDTLAPAMEEWITNVLEGLAGPDGLLDAIVALGEDENWAPLLTFLGLTIEEANNLVTAMETVAGWVSKLNQFNETTTITADEVNQFTGGLVDRGRELIGLPPLGQQATSGGSGATRGRPVAQPMTLAQRDPITVMVNMDSGNFAGARDGAQTGVDTALKSRGTGPF